MSQADTNIDATATGGKTATAIATATPASRDAGSQTTQRQAAVETRGTQPCKRRPMSAEQRAKLSAAQLAYSRQ